MTMDKHSLHSGEHEPSDDSPTAAVAENGHESYHSVAIERARRAASTESEHSTSSATTKSESSWISETTTSASGSITAPGAMLLIDDLFIGQTLHKICPVNFTDFWLASVQAKYLASFLNDSSAPEKTELLSLVCFNPDSSVHLGPNIVARDRTLYLSNVCEILSTIGQFQRQREQLRGDSGADKKGSNSSSSADVDLLLKDIRSYILTSTTNNGLVTGGESTKATTVQGDCNANKSSQAMKVADDQRHVLQNGAGGDVNASRRRHSSCSSSSLLGSVLCRLTKLLHGCIESEATRYDFYQIFSDAIHGTKTDNSSESYRNLNNLVNSLANFDLNSSQIMLDVNVPGSSSSQSVKPPMSSTTTTTSGDRECTPPSTRKDSFFSPSGTTHFYQSVIDCCDELSTSGGSTSSSSGYGRSSTTSNSSGVGHAAQNGALGCAPQLESGHISPSAPLFRDILLSKPGSALSTARSSVSPGAIGSGSVTASHAEPLSSSESLNSSFLNSSLAAVASDLCDLNDLPKLIPPSESAQHGIYGSPFDLRLPTFTNASAPQGILDHSSPSISFFSEYSQRALFDDHSSSNSNVGSTSKGFTISAVSPPSSSSNQCFTISMDQESVKGSLLDKRTAVEVASACLTDSYPQTPSGLSNGGTTSTQNSPPVKLVERDLFYRLIISQLLYHNHRNIAIQLAQVEGIKADGSLLSPSDRLHMLVSTAFRSEINQISVNPNPDIALCGGGHRATASSAPYQLLDSNGMTKEQTAANGLTGRSLLEEGNGFVKPLYDRSQSHLGHTSYSSLLFNSTPNGKVGVDSAEMNDATDYGDVPIDSVPDVYCNSTDMYFTGSSGSAGRIKQNSQSSSHLEAAPLANRSQSNNSLRSGPMEISTPGSTPVKSPPLLASTVLDLNAPSGSNSVSFVLMKNLNQLASKLNDVAGDANGADASAGPGPIFGRSASAMASMNSNNTTTSLANVMAVHQMVAHGTSSANYPGQLSRSPVPSLNGASKSPLGLVANGVTIGPLGPSHTTGNGKNHKIMQIRSKFGSLGSQTNQFSSPHGFCLGVNEEIVIADTNNHRICVYEKNGTFKHSFGNAGKDEGQLWYPRKITMICSANVRGTLANPYYVICDRGMERSRMQIFTRMGNFVRKIPIRYIDIVAGIAVNTYGQIVTVDSVSPTIFIISETGDLVEWFDCSDHMREPSDIAIYKKEYYICDFKGHCVVVFNERGKCLRKIGIESLTSFPNGIDISANGDILVGDSHGNRFHVAIFNQEGKLLTEYECPYVKVSRCCGLKLTSEGYVVTLAKNNHHVLVLNTLYIT